MTIRNAEHSISIYSDIVNAALDIIIGPASPRALEALTGISEEIWISDHAYDNPPVRRPRCLPLVKTLQGVPGAVGLFSEPEWEECPGLLEVLHLAALGDESRALQALARFMKDHQSDLGPEALNLGVTLLFKCLSGFRIDTSDRQAMLDHLELCRETFSLIVGCGCQVELPHVLFQRGRGIARLAGKPNMAAFFELLIGATNVCNHSGHGDSSRHSVMGHGIKYLKEHGSPEDLLEASPYFGIWNFMEGRYRHAMESFSIARAQLQEKGQSLMALYCLRHWLFAAFNLGMHGFVERELHSRLREAEPRSDSQLAGTIRGQLAGCLLRTGKLDQALRYLETPSGTSPRHDVVGFITNSRQLAYYHLLDGNVRKSWQVFSSAMAFAVEAGYTSPLYLSCVLLELLQAFHDEGLPAVPGYDLGHEIVRCVNGPNRLLRGIGLRMQAHELAKSGKFGDAEDCCRKSLEALQDVSIQELNKTQLAFASLLLMENRRDMAAILACPAWIHHASMPFFWSRELEELVPGHLRTRIDGRLRATDFAALYAKRIAKLKLGEEGPDAFLHSFLRASCVVLEASCGLLYRMDGPLSRPVLLGAVGPGGPWKPEGDALPAWDFEKLAETGEPHVDDVSAISGTSTAAGTTAAIPIARTGGGTFILCHYGFSNSDIRYIMEPGLLKELGRIAGEKLTVLVSASSGIEEESAEKNTRFTLHHHDADTEFLCVSPAMKEILRSIGKVAGTDASVLVIGESGTGKELVARRIHKESGRTGLLVSLNMAGLSEDLAANELFGHEKGAYTGAQ